MAEGFERTASRKAEKDETEINHSSFRFLLSGLEVKKESKKEKEPLEDLLPRRKPGDGFHMDGMGRKQKTPKEGRPEMRIPWGLPSQMGRKCSESKKDHEACQDIEEDVRNVISQGV